MKIVLHKNVLNATKTVFNVYIIRVIVYHVKEIIEKIVIYHYVNVYKVIMKVVTKMNIIVYNALQNV